MGYTCDFCGKEASVEHKISCKRCYTFLLYLLGAFETPRVKKAEKIKGKVKKKERALEKKKSSATKTKRELQFEKTISQKADPASLLTKCATCEFSFLDVKKKISCTEGKEPKSCGH